MILWLVFILVLIILVSFLHYMKCFRYWKDKNVPYKIPVPIFGNFMDVTLGRKQVGEAIREIYNKFEDSVPYFGLYIFHKPFLVIRDKELVKQILIKDFNVFKNRPLYFNDKIDPLAANALFILRGEVWKTLRNKLTPIYTSGKMRAMLPLMKEIADQMEEYVDTLTGNELDVRDLASRYSIDVICSCAFGINAQSLGKRNNEVKDVANKMFDLRSLKRSFSIGAYFFCPLMVKLFKLTFMDRKHSEYFIDLFKNSYEERIKLKVKRNDLIDLLHNLKQQERHDDNFKFDDAKMSAQALVFFTAGSETTVGTLSFCFYELAMNLEIQNELRREILQNLDTDGNISYETLLEMTYLDMVIKETLRKYPLTHLLMRYPEQDYTFRKTGLKLEKDTPVLISMTSLHYDERYFPNPDKFDPERFSEENAKKLQYVYLPFGDGPRKCIGDRVTPNEHTEKPVIQSKTAFFIIPDSGSIHLDVEKIV